MKLANILSTGRGTETKKKPLGGHFNKPPMNNESLKKAVLGRSPISPVKNESFSELQQKMQIVNYDISMNEGKIS